MKCVYDNNDDSIMIVSGKRVFKIDTKSCNVLMKESTRKKIESNETFSIKQYDFVYINENSLKKVCFNCLDNIESDEHWMIEERNVMDRIFLHSSCCTDFIKEAESSIKEIRPDIVSDKILDGQD